MKKVFLIGICCLAILMFNVALFAQASMSATSVDDPALVPGSTFTVEVWAHNVTGLWGFQFALEFDPTIIQCLNFQVDQEFTLPWPSMIDNQLGVVAVSASRFLGDRSGITADHVLLATLYFQVVGLGASELTLNGPLLVATWGNTIFQTSAVYGAYFSNLEEPIEDIISGALDLHQRAGWPNAQWRVELKDSAWVYYLTLYARVRHFKPWLSFNGKVRFTITTTDKKSIIGTFETDVIRLKPNETRDVSVTILVSDLPWLKNVALSEDMYMVIAQAFYTFDGRTWMAGKRIKRFGLPLQ